MVLLCGAGRTDNRGRQPPQGKSASARSPRQGSDKTARPATIFTHNGAPAGAGWLLSPNYLPVMLPVIPLLRRVRILRKAIGKSKYFRARSGGNRVILGPFSLLGHEIG